MLSGTARWPRTPLLQFVRIVVPVLLIVTATLAESEAVEPPLLCEDIKDAPNKDYVTLFYAKDTSKPFRAYCQRKKVQRQGKVSYPMRTYIDLPHEGPSNTFEYLKGPLMEGSEKMVTTYWRVRVTQEVQTVKASGKQNSPTGFGSLEDVSMDEGKPLKQQRDPDLRVSARLSRHR